jgi:hypothetical protein
VAALVLVPAGLDLALSGRERVFGYLGADAFYYFAVARNMVDHGVVSFDQTHLTNGFHPLWQGVVAVLAWLVRSRAVFLYAVVGVSAAAVALAFHRLARTWERVIGRASPVGLLLLTGPWALVLFPWWARREPAAANIPEGPFPLFGSGWSWINGMETGVALVFFALLVERIALPSERRERGIGFGLLLAGLVLARLDLALFVPGLLAVWALGRRARGEGLRPGVHAAAVVGGVIAAYVAVNGIFFGSLLPVSGAAKSTFPRICKRNFVELGDMAGKLSQVRFEAIVRYGQILIPLVLAAGWLIFRGLRRRRPASGWTAALDGVSVGVIALAAYDLLFVNTVHQWHWYFPVSIVFVALVAFAPLEAVRARSRVGSVAVTGVLLALAAAVFLVGQRRPGYHRLYAQFFYETAPGVREHYGDAPPNLISMDDGIVAWATGFPALAGRGLMLDAEAAAARRDGRFLDLCRARGFDRVTALAYMRNFVPARANPDSARFARRYGRRVLRRMPTDGLEFTIDYLAPNLTFMIVGIEWPEE